MSSVPTPAQPESWDALQARYREAVQDVYDQQAVAEGRLRPPSQRAQHIFDTPEGIRLIVARERTPERKLVLHVSASRLDHPWTKDLSLAFAQIAVAFQHLSGMEDAAMDLIAISDGGIPHFYVWLPTVH